MALQSDPFQITKHLITETASTNISLGRIVGMATDGSGLSTAFPVNIFYDDIVYEVDDEGKKIAIYERKNSGAYQLSPIQAYQLFTTQVTLQDGTATYLGELIAKLTDDIIKQYKVETLITSHPQDITASIDDTIKFSVSHQDVPAVSFQWKKDGIDIPGAISSILTLGHVALEDNNTKYNVVLTLPYGSIESNQAELTVV